MSRNRLILLFISTVFIFLSGMFPFEKIPDVKAEDHARTLYKLPDSMKGAKYVGMDTCITCHEVEGKQFKLSTHARLKISGDSEEANGCEMCHGPGSIHADNGGGKGTILNPRKNPEVCLSCHMEKKAEFRLPYHHPVLEGKMSCVDCHTPHGVDVRPWTATSERDINEVCLKCHTDKRGPFTWEHDAIKEGCTACHRVHGSVNDKMLVARDSTLCLRCHAQINFPNIGSQNHWTSRLPSGTCWSTGCHEAVHGSNFYEKLRQ